jgi:hypothetical protein
LKSTQIWTRRKTKKKNLEEIMLNSCSKLRIPTVFIQSGKYADCLVKPEIIPPQ